MKYEKPIAKELGQILSVAHGTCGTGSTASDVFDNSGKCSFGMGEGNAICQGGAVVTKLNPNSCATGIGYYGRVCGSGGTPDLIVG